jgi:two-component system, sensor histidine kinase
VVKTSLNVGASHRSHRVAGLWRSLVSVRRAGRSVSGKLMAVILSTAAIALLVSGLSVLITDVYHDRRAWGEDLATTGQILALASAPALSFQDQAAADRNLAAFTARPSIRVAALYLSDGRLYSKYTAARNLAVPSQLPRMGAGLHFAGNRATLITPIVQRGESVGTVYLQAEFNLSDRIWAYMGILTLVLVLGLAVAGVAASWLKRSITRPLSSITDAAREIVSGGEYSIRVSKTTEDEFGLVIDAFNNMLARVQQRTRDLEASNVALREEAKVREATQEALRQGELALRDADRRKDEFLATLAHELRNPLSPIRHAAKILEIARTDERQREWAREVIARQVERMALLLDDLLDISRITRGRLELRKDYVPLESVVNSAIETARPLIEAKRHTLQVILPPSALTLEVDPLRLSQALSNLITNAAKYTDAGGKIEVRASLEQQDLLLCVTDNGIGISEEAISRIFEMFTQLRGDDARAEGGLGIGLALVRGLISLSGGTVEARSAGPGLGSSFTIRLPRSLVVEDAQSKPHTVLAHSTLGPRCKVLLADDNRDAVDSLALVLGISGFEVHVAHSGREAIELAAREKPDACILDIGMPELDGYETARRMRQQAWARRALLVAVTGWGQADDKQRAAAVGFDRHFTKPVNPDQIVQCLVEYATHLRGVPTDTKASGSGVDDSISHLS